jgi:hypothetical protein
MPASSSDVNVDRIGDDVDRFALLSQVARRSHAPRGRLGEKHRNRGDPELRTSREEHQQVRAVRLQQVTQSAPPQLGAGCCIRSAVAAMPVEIDVSLRLRIGRHRHVDHSSSVREPLAGVGVEDVDVMGVGGHVQHVALVHRVAVGDTHDHIVGGALHWCRRRTRPSRAPRPP